MALDTKPNLSSEKFEQFSGDTLNLSGTTNFYKAITLRSGSTFTILPNKGVGKVLTSDADGIMTLQPSNNVTGIANNIVVVASGGTGSVDSGIPIGLILASL